MISKTIGFRGLASFQTNPYFCDDPDDRFTLLLVSLQAAVGIGAKVVALHLGNRYPVMARLLALEVPKKKL